MIPPPTHQTPPTKRSNPDPGLTCQNRLFSRLANLASSFTCFGQFRICRNCSFMKHLTGGFRSYNVFRILSVRNPVGSASSKTTPSVTLRLPGPAPLCRLPHLLQSNTSVHGQRMQPRVWRTGLLCRPHQAGHHRYNQHQHHHHCYHYPRPHNIHHHHHHQASRLCLTS